MQEREYEPPKLIKPIFIEESFTASIFNEVMAKELRQACAWLQEKDICDEKLKKNIYEIIEEILQFNERLLKKYGFYEKGTKSFALLLADDYSNVNPDIRTNAIENIVVAEYLKDYQGFQELLYYVTDALFRCRFSDTVDTYTVNERYMLDLLFRFLDGLYSGNEGYYTVMVNKYEN